MTTTQLQLRRDTTANIDTITPAQGELLADITRNALSLGDGSQLGGHYLTPFFGTWTPTIFGATTAGTQTYNAALTGGWWCKVNKLIVLSGVITLTANSGGVGTAYISGTLPASINLSGTALPVGAGILSTIGGVTHAASYTQFGVELDGSTSPILALKEFGSNLAQAYVPITNVGAAAVLTFLAVYQGATDNT